MSKIIVSPFTDNEAKRLDQQAVQVNDSSPEELKREIEKTREHMDENLALLGRKLSPKRLKALQTPLAIAFLVVTGIFLYIRFRHGWKVQSRRPKPSLKSNYKVKQVRLGSLGRLAQLRTFLQLVSVARRGKPAVFIVQPMKS